MNSIRLSIDSVGRVAGPSLGLILGGVGGVRLLRRLAGFGRRFLATRLESRGNRFGLGATTTRAATTTALALVGRLRSAIAAIGGHAAFGLFFCLLSFRRLAPRSEERRVGKECR